MIQRAIRRAIRNRLRRKSYKSENVRVHMRADHGSIAALLIENVDLRRRADDE